ncbi:EI24 domain-containing protein [Streptomonospora wellingtoniae]|uniref:EI24 domain-containing protein n=1 Tax=Streptomonospora wellingtoniae TaxID=3075544 RepID=A0ABU2KT23_9ACTN|nr:EI24 domain-containing protein [Streptomonospora sp. DSM 45055]MDT0302432.1 EI24 domain-containing protein [Streptomonospora sp. DSM 45055]
MSTPLRDLFSGVGVLLKGAGMVIRNPRLFVLGMIPPLVTSLLFVAAFAALLLNIDDLTAWLTPFADGWSSGMQTTLRVAAGVMLVAGAVLIMVVAFTGLTLALGFPLYDTIAEMVDDELGDAPPDSDEPVVRSVVRALRQSLGLITVSALVAIPLFAGGFIPVVGQTVIPVVSAIFGGWMLTIELLGAAFDRRGRRRIKDRRDAMKQRRMLVLGFGIPSYLLLAVPFVAVLVFPAATAGGTILARRLLPAAPLQTVDATPPPIL